jgi:hypothetical protein
MVRSPQNRLNSLYSHLSGVEQVFTLTCRVLGLDLRRCYGMASTKDCRRPCWDAANFDAATCPGRRCSPSNRCSARRPPRQGSGDSQIGTVSRLMHSDRRRCAPDNVVLLSSINSHRLRQRWHPQLALMFLLFQVERWCPALLPLPLLLVLGVANGRSLFITMDSSLWPSNSSSPMLVRIPHLWRPRHRCWRVPWWWTCGSSSWTSPQSDLLV